MLCRRGRMLQKKETILCTTHIDGLLNMWYIFNIKLEIHHIAKEAPMRSRYYMEGLLGLLSLLGFVGIFTDEKYFLSFFAFAVDFEYFFIQTDEMMDRYMDKAAARAFYCDMFATGVVTAGCILFGHSLQQAMLYGVCTGWGLAVAVQALLVAYYRTRESLGAGHDPQQN